MHGGWGYEVYPIDRQIEEFVGEFRFVIPDRSGYGRSSELRSSRETPIDFHRRAAEETLLVLDALGIERAVFRGHSDGAVIAAKIGLLAPERCEQLILEAFHFYRGKPGSHNFFQRNAHHPEEVSEKLRSLLAADHGERWQTVIQRNCWVWLKLAELGARAPISMMGDWANLECGLHLCMGDMIRGLSRMRWNGCGLRYLERRFVLLRVGGIVRIARVRLGGSATRYFAKSPVALRFGAQP